MQRLRISALAGLLALVTTAGCEAQTPDRDRQIAEAMLPAPESQRDDATVLGYTADGALVPLREGDGDLVCLADKPGDDRFHASCYHKALEPYMARGRALRAEGITGQESLEIRHKEADAGALQMPSAPAAVYNVSGPLDGFDPATAAVTLYAVYIPYATEASTGIAEAPSGPGAPWIMRPGTASAHIMIVPPAQ